MATWLLLLGKNITNKNQSSYIHQTTGLSFNYSPTYKITEQPQNGGTDFISLNNDDGVKIDIYISDNPGGETLDNLVANFDSEQNAGPISAPKPIDKKYISIAGEKAMSRRWVESGTGNSIKGGDEVFFIHNGKFFEFIRFFNNTKKQNEFEDILQSIAFNGTSIYNFGKINFPYEKSWQIVESNGSNENINTLDFHIKSLCINKEAKPIVSGTEIVCDITIADYSPSYFQLKEQKAILDLNQFVNFISSQGQDETLSTPTINNFITDNAVSMIKWVGPHPLSSELIESYFFEYVDQTNQSHYIHLFGNPVKISANDMPLKSFVNQIIKSIYILS